MASQRLRSGFLTQVRICDSGRDVSGFPIAARTEDTNMESKRVFIVEDDDLVRETLRAMIEDDGRTVEDFATGEEFIESYQPGGDTCLLADVNLPGMNGVDLLRQLNESGNSLPTIIISGNAKVPMAVEAMKAGATNVVEKPISSAELIANVEHALGLSRSVTRKTKEQRTNVAKIATLTARQKQILQMVVAGERSKNIAADLGISQRTVEQHRAVIMKKTGAKSVPALTKVALGATEDTSEG